MAKLMHQDRDEHDEDPFDEQRQIACPAESQKDADDEERRFNLDGDAKEFHAGEI
jgi:hypothetical protein